MRIVGKKEEVEANCRNLWQECFHDSEEYISWYFGAKWQGNEVFLLQDDTGEICSMLHCNPYHVKYEEKELYLYYIVGVCTRVNQRKKGYMGKVLRECFRWLYEQEVPFTYLMPARAGIYEPYDFRRIYQAKKERIEKNIFLEKESRYYFVDYFTADRKQKKELERNSQRWLSSSYSIYVTRTQDYFQELAEQMEACHGKCLMVYEGEELKGYFAYGSEDEEIEVIEVVGDVEREKLYGSFGEYLKEDENNTDKGFRVLVTPFPEGVTEDAHSIMARIIHFPKCACLLCSSRPQSWKVKINDRFIAENNGKWLLNMDSKGCQVTAMQAEEAVDKEMDIQEFCDFFFRNQKVYINEIV